MPPFHHRQMTFVETKNHFYYCHCSFVYQFFFSYFTRWQLKKCNAKHIKKTIKKLHSTTKQVKLKSKKIKGIFQKQNAKTLQYLCYFYLI